MNNKIYHQDHFSFVVLLKKGKSTFDIKRDWNWTLLLSPTVLVVLWFSIEIEGLRPHFGNHSVPFWTVLHVISSGNVITLNYFIFCFNTINNE